MSFICSENIGKEYKDFVLVELRELKDYKAKGAYLRHKRTGLEIFHVIKDDPENLFAFTFRTLSKDSKGTAHIMEHSTLTGSERFPLKEPFTTLENQSVKTFLNALTYPDMTVYPASSQVKADYFNLLDVYGDAVFFPLLTKDTFMQEGHRLELDEKGKLSIQGVVYNEMKGNYSSFNSVAADEQISALFPDSVYSYDSGGDPLEIPSLTYQEFLDFHKKFYNPGNCILFLYGNISTEEQIDFLTEKFISRIEKSYGFEECVQNVMNTVPAIASEIKELLKIHKIEKSKLCKLIAPDTGASGNLVCCNWYTGDYSVEKIFLSEVLCGCDSSPLSRKLKASGLGDDLSIMYGDIEHFSENFMCYGLSGVKKGNENKVLNLVGKAIEEVYKEGISESDVKSAIMSCDFDLREVTRYMGPYSLEIMNKVISGWRYGKSPYENLSPITEFEEFKKRLAADEKLPEKLIKKYLIDPEVRVDVIVEPSSEYFKARKQKEEDLIKKLGEKLDKEQLKKDLERLHQYQQKKETEEELKCIPHVQVKDLSPDDLKRIETKFTTIKGFDGSEVPYVMNEEETNGIFYIDVLFPFDNQKPEILEKLPMLASTLTNLGWNNQGWVKSTSKATCVVGDVWAKLTNGSIINAPWGMDWIKSYEKYNINGRGWIVLCCKALTSMAKETLELLSEIIVKMDFKDRKHFKALLNEHVQNRKSSIIPNGVNYAITRSSSGRNEDSMLAEIFSGFSQLYTQEEMKKTRTSRVLHTFEEIYTTARKSGAMLHVTADKASLEVVNRLLPAFAEASELKTPCPKKGYTKEELEKCIRYANPSSEAVKRDMVNVTSQTGFAACVSGASPYLTRESSAEIVLTKWLSLHALWEKLRTTGGAYGAGAYVDSTEKTLVMYTYRDPTPEKSFGTYLSSLEECIKNPFTQEETDCAIIAIYSDLITPKSPGTRGNIGLDRFLYGLSEDMKHKQLELLLGVKKDDLNMAARRLYEAAVGERMETVICDKSVECCGNLLKLPL